MKRRTTSTSLERPVASSEGEIRRTFPTWLSHWRSQRLGSGRRIAASSRWEASPCTGRPTSFTSHCKAQGASNRTRDVDWGLGLEHAIPLADEPHGDWEATRASLLTVGSIPARGYIHAPAPRNSGSRYAKNSFTFRGHRGQRHQVDWRVLVHISSI